MDKGAEHRTFSLIASAQSPEATEPTNSTLNAVVSLQPRRIDDQVTEDWFAFMLKQPVDFVIYPPS